MFLLCLGQWLNFTTGCRQVIFVRVVPHGASLLSSDLSLSVRVSVVTDGRCDTVARRWDNMTCRQRRRILCQRPERAMQEICAGGLPLFLFSIKPHKFRNLTVKSVQLAR